VKLLRERLREEIDRLMIIYGIGEHEYISFRQVKLDLTEDIKRVFREQGAADNTALEIYMEDTTFVVRVGEFLYRWN
jgi:hypothetical protein